ncbi:MAG: beta-galactosidase [Ruminococcaceae bacterium]|nr:beta-galactosidase [Oscillospiraceae bacterium]
MGILTFNNGKFYMDQKPYTVMSGAMHYFRIPREYWRDRLLKLLECGLNTVETYTPWNLHEPREGEFDFSGNLDIEAYIDTAASLGLNVILRPGPYICAEWDMGGLPSWLLTYEKMSLRCNDPAFLSKVERYYKELLPRIRPRLSTNGGNVFMLQIENEYGSFGDDKEYLRAVADIYRNEGMDCLLFTSDGPCLSMLSGGSLEGYLCTSNFGSRPWENFQAVSAFRPGEPSMCCEYWCGWFDHWGEEHHVRPPEEVRDDILEFTKLCASFNIYMFHGGTNFAFTNGANHDKGYQPTVTSYDYNAPLSEAGDRTPLYYQIREIIKKSGAPVPEMTARDSKKAAYGKVRLTRRALLFDNLDNLSRPVFSPEPKDMEELFQDFGYILYRTKMAHPSDGWELHFDRVSDRAQIFVNGELRGIAERQRPESLESTHIGIPLSKGESARLDILCENMGRVNYGPKIRDPKGIKGVRFGNQYHFGWEMYPLPMKDLSRLCFEESDAIPDSPAFFEGNLRIDEEPCDTFLRLDGFTKGFVTVNGTNIGRYFNPPGPQKTLYVPAPFLRKGDNRIIVFESDKTDRLEIEFTDSHDLG